MCPRKGWEPLGILGGDAQNIRLGPECCREPPGHATTPLHRSPGSPSAGTPPRARVFGGRMFATPLFPPSRAQRGTISGSGGRGSVSAARAGGGQPRELPAPPPHPGQLGDAGTAPGFGVPISCQGLWPVPAVAQRGEGAAPLFRGFLSCSYPLSWRNRNCFVPSGVIFSGSAYILALSQRRVGGPTWDGGRGPRWPGVGTGSRGGCAPAGCTPGVWCHGDRPAHAPGRDFPRGCTVELFGVLCAPQVMHSASGVCPLPRPSVGSRGHGWAGHPHVPHPEHPEPPVTGRHWGSRHQHPACTQGWGYPLPAPSPGRLLPPSASPLGIAPGPLRIPNSSRTSAQSRVAQGDIHAWTSPGTTYRGTVAGPPFVPSTPACHPGGSCPSRCHRALCDGP